MSSRIRGTVTMICHDFNYLPLPSPRPKDGVCHTLNAEIHSESHLLAGTPMFVAPHKLILKHVTFSKRRKSILLNVLSYVKCFRWKVGHKALTSTFSMTKIHERIKTLQLGVIFEFLKISNFNSIYWSEPPPPLKLKLTKKVSHEIVNILAKKKIFKYSVTGQHKSILFNFIFVCSQYATYSSKREKVCTYAYQASCVPSPWMYKISSTCTCNYIF